MRECPECSRVLVTSAKSCQCGWRLDPAPTRADSPLLRHALDHQCVWNHQGERCLFPVNFFEPGQTKSFCRYHKRTKTGEHAFGIMRLSYTMSDADYDRATSAETYGEELTKRLHGRFVSPEEMQQWRHLFVDLARTPRAVELFEAAGE
jgi:hypothetical protein